MFTIEVKNDNELLIINKLLCTGLSLGNAGLQMESLTIWIPSRPTSIINFGPIQILQQKLYCQTRFPSFSISF